MSVVNSTTETVKALAYDLRRWKAGINYSLAAGQWAVQAIDVDFPNVCQVDGNPAFVNQSTSNPIYPLSNYLFIVSSLSGSKRTDGLGNYTAHPTSQTCQVPDIVRDQIQSAITVTSNRPRLTVDAGNVLSGDPVASNSPRIFDTLCTTFLSPGQTADTPNATAPSSTSKTTLCDNTTGFLRAWRGPFEISTVGKLVVSLDP